MIASAAIERPNPQQYTGRFRDTGFTRKATAPLTSDSTSKNLLALFDFTKKSELEKHAKQIAIHKGEFANLVAVAKFEKLGPYQHDMYSRDFIPDHLQPRSEDAANLGDIEVGKPLPRSAQKFFRKVNQIFKQRRFLVGHLFYMPCQTRWHFFYFDQRDMSVEAPANHWRGGPHLHLINWLWPNWTAETLWDHFVSGNVKLGGSLHIRWVVDSPHDDDDAG